MQTLITWLLTCVAPIAPVDIEIVPHPWIAVSDGGDYYVRFDPPADRPFDVARSKVAAFKVGPDGKDTVLWQAEGWYAFGWDAWLSDDGRHLARIGLWARGELPKAADVAVAFHEDGRVVRSYSTRELVKDDSRVPHTASHYQWQRDLPRFSDSWHGGFLELTTIDDIRYTFDIRTGEIVKQEPAGPEQPAPAVPVDTRDVDDAVRAYYAALSARDWTAFATHFEEGAVLSTRWTPPGTTSRVIMMSSVAEFVARAPEGPGSQPIFEEWPTHIDVRRQGDMAMAWVNYRVRFGSPGALREWTGVDAITLILHEGRWRITSIAWSGD